LEAVIGNSGSQMGFAAGTGTHEYQPSLRVLGKGGGCPGGTEEPLLVGGITASSLGYQVVEGEAGQGTQVAVALQSSQTVSLQFSLHTLTGHHPAVIGAAGRQAGIDESRTLAPRARRRCLFGFSV